jgi:hypothetical protein
MSGEDKPTFEVNGVIFELNTYLLGLQLQTPKHPLEDICDGSKALKRIKEFDV